MATHANELASRTSRRRHLVGAVTVISATLSLAAIPTATARPGHEKSAAAEAPATSETPAKAAAPEASKPEKTVTKGEGGEVKPPKPAKHAKHTEAPPVADEGASSGSAQQAPPARHAESPRHRQDGGKGADARGHSKGTSSTGAQGRAAPNT